MKLFFVGIFLLPVFCRAAPGDFQDLVKQERSALQSQAVKMQYLQDLSKISAPDSADLVERDLAICEGVGAAQEGISQIQSAHRLLEGKLADGWDKQEMKDLEGALIGAWSDMRLFCLRVNEKLYRQIPFLQERVQKSQNILEAWDLLLLKYE